MNNHWIESRASKSLHLWVVDDGETWWYSASSSEEVMEMHAAEIFGYDAEDLEGIEIRQVSSDERIPIVFESEGCTRTKTAEEWAKEGKGLVGSTMFDASGCS